MKNLEGLVVKSVEKCQMPKVQGLFAKIDEKYERWKVRQPSRKKTMIFVKKKNWRSNMQKVLWEGLKYKKREKVRNFMIRRGFFVDLQALFSLIHLWGPIKDEKFPLTIFFSLLFFDANIVIFEDFYFSMTY